MKIPKANKIAEVRKQRQLTQQQLADKVGVHWMTISKLERGRMQLTQDWIEKIALALGVPLARLVSWDPLVREIMTKGVITEGFVVEEEEHAESRNSRMTKPSLPPPLGILSMATIYAPFSFMVTPFAFSPCSKRISNT